MTVELIRRSDARPAWAIWMVLPFALGGLVYQNCYIVECDGQRMALTERERRGLFAAKRASRAKEQGAKS